MCFCAEYSKEYPLHLSLHVLLQHLVVVGLLGLLVLLVLQLPHLLLAYIRVFVRHLDHHPLLLDLPHLPLVHVLLVHYPLVLYLQGLGLVLLPDALGRYHAVFPLGLDPAGLEGNALMVLVDKGLPLLSEFPFLDEALVPDLDHFLVFIFGLLHHVLLPAEVDLEVAHAVADRGGIGLLSFGFLPELVDAVVKGIVHILLVIEGALGTLAGVEGAVLLFDKERGLPLAFGTPHVDLLLRRVADRFPGGSS